MKKGIQLSGLDKIIVGITMVCVMGFLLGVLFLQSGIYFIKVEREEVETSYTETSTKVSDLMSQYKTETGFEKIGSNPEVKTLSLHENITTINE